MITEQELKDKCTPEFIKWMCELAEGFEWRNENNVIWTHVPSDIIMVGSKYFSNDSYFPLLIHRAVEGCNNFIADFLIYIKCSCVDRYKNSEYVIYCFENYQSQTLTQAECAMLHCLLDIFKEQEGRDERK